MEKAMAVVASGPHRKDLIDVADALRPSNLRNASHMIAKHMKVAFATRRSKGLSVPAGDIESLAMRAAVGALDAEPL
jgi:hypothetical protein